MGKLRRDSVRSGARGVRGLLAIISEFVILMVTNPLISEKISCCVLRVDELARL